MVESPKSGEAVFEPDDWPADEYIKHRPTYEEVIGDILDYAQLRGASGKRALDLGCGPGNLSFELQRNGCFSLVTAVDPSHVCPEEGAQLVTPADDDCSSSSAPVYAVACSHLSCTYCMLRRCRPRAHAIWLCRHSVDAEMRVWCCSDSEERVCLCRSQLEQAEGLHEIRARKRRRRSDTSGDRSYRNFTGASKSLVSSRGKANCAYIRDEVKAGAS